MKTRTNIIISLSTLALSATLLSGNAAASDDCKMIEINASGESAGAVARFRKKRAERRAKNSWENYVIEHYGKKYADIDDAKSYKVVFSLNAKGNTVATVYGQPCVG